MHGAAGGLLCVSVETVGSTASFGCFLESLGLVERTATMPAT